MLVTLYLENFNIRVISFMIIFHRTVNISTTYVIVYSLLRLRLPYGFFVRISILFARLQHPLTTYKSAPKQLC